MEEIVGIYQEVYKHKNIDETIGEFFSRIGYDFYHDIDTILLISHIEGTFRIKTESDMRHFFRKHYRKDKIKRIL